MELVQNKTPADAIRRMQRLHGEPHTVFVDAPFCAFAPGLDLFAQCSDATGRSLEVSTCAGVLGGAGHIAFFAVPNTNVERFRDFLATVVLPDVKGGGIVTPAVVSPGDPEEGVLAQLPATYRVFVGLVHFILPNRVGPDDPKVQAIKEAVAAHLSVAAAGTN